MSLLDDLKGIRDMAHELAKSAEKAMRRHRYRDRSREEAILDVLSDGKWHSITDVTDRLERGGLDLSHQLVGQALRSLNGLESKRERHGWQGGRKVYRLANGS